MSYIKKNVNLLMLLLTIFILLSFMGISVYYQDTQSRLNKDFNQKVEELTDISGKLDSRRSELNQTYTELQLRLADKTKFDQLYVELSSEKETLEKDLFFTEDQLSSTKSRLKKVEDDLDNTEKDLSAAQLQIVNLQEDLAFNQARVKSLENQLCSLKQQIGEPC